MHRLLLILTIAAACLVAPAAANARPLYTNLYTDQLIASFSVGQDGTTAPLAGSPLAVGGYVQSISIAPGAKHLVAQFPFATDQFLKVFAIDASGSLTQVGAPVPSTSASPNVFSPDGRFMYAPSKTNGVEAYSFSAGTLTSLGTAGSTQLSEVVVTPDGRFVFGLDYNSANICRFAVQANGSLVDIGSAPVLETGSQSARITPDGQFLILVTDPAGTGHTSSYSIGPEGQLVQTGSSVINAGAITNRSPMSPNGRFVFVTNGNEDSISTVSIGTDGSLAKPLPDVFSGVTSPGDAAVSTDGRILFVQNQGGDFIQPFVIGEGGSLTAFGAPVATGGGTDGSTPLMLPAQAPSATAKITRRQPGKRSVFDATGSVPASGSAAIANYAWDFGDGSTAVATSPRTNHTYKKAGVYDVTLRVTDGDGCSASRIFDGFTTLCNGAASAAVTTKVDTPPALTKLKVTPSRFSPGQRAKIKFRLSEKSRVTLTVKKGRKRIGVFRVNGRRGTNSLKFTGRIKGRPLAPGKYRLSAQARDRKGGRSISVSKRFTIR